MEALLSNIVVAGVSHVALPVWVCVTLNSLSELLGPIWPIRSVKYLLKHFFLCRSQCDGEPLFTQPQLAEQRGRPVQLQDHLAGVCGGPGLLEGPAAAGGHRPPLPGYRLLCERGPAFLHQPAGAGALKEG